GRAVGRRSFGSNTQPPLTTRQIDCVLRMLSSGSALSNTTSASLPGVRLPRRPFAPTAKGELEDGFSNRPCVKPGRFEKPSSNPMRPHRANQCGVSYTFSAFHPLGTSERTRSLMPAQQGHYFAADSPRAARPTLSEVVSD